MIVTIITDIVTAQRRAGEIVGASVMWNKAFMRRLAIALSVMVAIAGLAPAASAEWFLDWASLTASDASRSHSFGMRSVLLIINEPETAHSSVSGCSAPGPSRTTPAGSASPTCPRHAVIDTIATRTRLVGIGVPSKYFTVSAPAESDSAVTLKRASRLTPQQTK